VNNSYSATVTARSAWKKGNGSWNINGTFQLKVGTRCYHSSSGWFNRGQYSNELKDYLCSAYSNLYSCPNGGSLIGTTCTKIDTEYKNFTDI
jgi:hypothetical protein